MRLIKMILVILLVTVTALYGYAKFDSALSGENQGPTIHCEQELVELSVRDDRQVLMEGVSASDPQDGDLTDRILFAGVSQLITEDTATATYLVFDSDNNMAQLQRTVRYTDYRKPRIMVSQPLTFTNENTSGIMDLIRAEDVIDGDISDKIRLSNLWITEYTDVYSLTVLVTNSMGDTAKMDLPVIIQDELNSRPVIRLRTQITYVEQGMSFDPEDYLSALTVNGEYLPVEDVAVEHQVNTNQPGSYWVHYSYSAGGIQGTAILTVVVG